MDDITGRQHKLPVFYILYRLRALKDALISAKTAEIRQIEPSAVRLTRVISQLRYTAKSAVSHDLPYACRSESRHEERLLRVKAKRYEHRSRHPPLLYRLAPGARDSGHKSKLLSGKNRH